MEESKGYQTNNRANIHTILKGAKNRTLTVDEIANQLNEMGASVNRTTIYRYLEKLWKEGKLMKYVVKKGGKTTYQLAESGSNCDSHLHLQCTECGKVLHLDCDFMEEMKQHITKSHHFQIEYRNSILYGLCEKCEKKKGN